MAAMDFSATVHLGAQEIINDYLKIKEDYLIRLKNAFQSGGIWAAVRESKKAAFQDTMTRRDIIQVWSKLSARFQSDEISIAGVTRMDIQRLQARMEQECTLAVRRKAARLPGEFSVAAQETVPAPPAPLPVKEKPLTERQNNILEAMLKMKATDEVRKKSTEDIAVVAEGQHVNPEAFKRSMADLKRRALIDTKSGPGGGCWLTDTGRDYAMGRKNQ